MTRGLADLGPLWPNQNTKRTRARARHGGAGAWGRNEAHCGALMAPLALCTWQLAVGIYAARAQPLGQDMRHMDGPSSGTLT